mmetsp:Transcript_14314/g.19089  ORF Transcript_14314/g.19089 Transcript_14314/m.19089 type:complete len:99 (+) Transcript_14314:1102-1398(+)
MITEVAAYLQQVQLQHLIQHFSFIEGATLAKNKHTWRKQALCKTVIFAFDKPWSEMRYIKLNSEKERLLCLASLVNFWGIILNMNMLFAIKQNIILTA